MWIGLIKMVFSVIKLMLITYICSRAYGLHDVTNESIPKDEDMELEREFQFLNRTSVIKTIQVEEGDIIDCIDINKQPSLNHSLLKNHEVQMRPRSFPAEMRKSFLVPKLSQTGPRKEACPFGTVPIHISPNDDSLKARILASKFINTIPSHETHVVSLRTNASQNIYRGAYGSVSVYNLELLPDQSSSANIWVENGPTGQVNSLAAGWMVSPILMDGDSTPRLFINWKGNGNTMCINMFCKGFVQVHQEIGPKYPIKEVSVYGGVAHDIKLTIYQDQHTGNWWLSFSEENVLIGYWPKEIIPKLKDGASLVAWGGITWAASVGVSPPMGSGHKPDGHYDHAAYFRQVHYIDRDFRGKVPSGNETHKYVDQYNCYDLKNDQDSGSKHWGYVFTFGGPGGFCGN